MKEVLYNRRNKKLRKNVLIDQQILALNKEEMEIKGEMLKEIKFQDQKFSRSMEAFQENMYNFINNLSQSMQMMSASFNSFQYRQVNHYQAPYHQQTWCSTRSFADVGKVNHYQDPYYQHNQSVNSTSSYGNTNQNIIGDGEKQ